MSNNYFTIHELTASSTAQRHGINNRPTDEVIDNLEYLIQNLLNPIRHQWGKPITVNSGYRNPELNKKVGGATNSQHVKGEAVDITTGTTMDNKKLFDLIVKSDLEYDQLIDEKKYTWIHVSLKKNNNRKQVLHL